MRIMLSERGGWLLQTADALDFIGERGIVYRDMKLENVMLSKDTNSVLVGDFGLVCCCSCMHLGLCAVVADAGFLEIGVFPFSFFGWGTRSDWGFSSSLVYGCVSSR